jgi:hypothetical protein
MNKKGQMGTWGGLLVLAIVMALFGLILTITADVQQDITDDQTDGSKAEEIGNNSLDAQVALSEKQSTLVTAGVGIFILSLLIAGFSLYRMG